MVRDEQEVDSLIVALESPQGENMALDIFDLDLLKVLADKDVPHPLNSFKTTMKDSAVNFFKALKKYHQMVDDAMKYGDKRKEYNDENKETFIRRDPNANGKIDFKGRRDFVKDFSMEDRFDTTVKPSAPVEPNPSQISDIRNIIQTNGTINKENDYIDDIMLDVGGELNPEMKIKIMEQIDGRDIDEIRDLVENEFNRDTKLKMDKIKTDIQTKIAKATENVRAALDKGDAVAKEICDKTVELHRKDPSRRKAKFLQVQVLCQSTKKQLVALIKDKINLQADETVKANTTLLTNVTNEKGIFATLLKTTNFICSENKRMLSLVDTNDDIQIWEHVLRRRVNKPIDEARANFEKIAWDFRSKEVENTMDETISDAEMEGKVKNIEELILALDLIPELMMIIKNSLNRRILYETLFGMTAATICQMTSGNATNFLELNSNNIPVSVKLSPADAKALAEAAMPIVAVFCTAVACLKTAVENSDEGIPASQSKIYKLCDQRTAIQFCLIDNTTCDDQLRKDVVDALFGPLEDKMGKVGLIKFSSVAEKSDQKLIQMTNEINIDEDQQTTNSIEKFDHRANEGLKNINTISFKDGKIVCTAESTEQLVTNGESVSEDDMKLDPEIVTETVSPEVKIDQTIQRILETVSAGTGETTVSFKVDSTLTYNMGDIAKASGLSVESVEGMVDEVNDLLKDPVTTTANPETIETTTKVVSRITAIFVTLSLALFIA